VINLCLGTGKRLSNHIPALIVKNVTPLITTIPAKGNEKETIRNGTLA